MNKKDYEVMYADYKSVVGFELPECKTIRDYIKVLSVLNGGDSSKRSFNDVVNSVPMHLRRRLEIYSPSLCYRYDELNDKQKDGVLTSEWCFVEKLDGIRSVMVTNGGGIYLYSREYGDDCLPYDYARNLTLSELTISGDYVVDVEITTCDMDFIHSRLGVLTTFEDFLKNPNAKFIESEYSSMHGKDLVTINILVPLVVDGMKLIDSKIGDLISLNKEIMYRLRASGLNAMYARQCFGGKHQKTIFLDSILSSGGEGIVAYNLNAVYDVNGKRSRDLFVKLKHTLSKNEVHDTIDCYVVGVDGYDFTFGYEVNVCGAVDEIRFKARVPHIHIDHDYDSILDYYYKDKVCEIKFLNVDGHKIVTPTFVRWRNDKMRYECSYDDTFFSCLTK